MEHINILKLLIFKLIIRFVIVTELVMKNYHLESRKRNDNLIQIFAQSRPVRHATSEFAPIVQFFGEDFASLRKKRMF